MIEELKKLTSFKLLIYLLIIAVSIYLFDIATSYVRLFFDIFLIFLFAWGLSFILEPFVKGGEKFFKLPRIVSTLAVFSLTGIILAASIFLLIPTVTSQFNSLLKILPDFVEKSPPLFRKVSEAGLDSFQSIIDYKYILPSIAQFFFNLVLIFILAFYLIVEKENMIAEILNITPDRWEKNIKFIQKTFDQTFASFLRIQLIWGVIGGITTWLVLAVFQVDFAVSTAFLAGILTAVPVIGPIIGIIPPLVISLIENSSQFILIIGILFILQQIIFNFLGTKIISQVFNINPVLVMASLLIGFKIAGAIGGVLAVPVVSIALVLGKEFYNFYFKGQKSL